MVDRHAKELFNQAAKECNDEFSQEIIEGVAQSVDDVANLVTRTQQATQTLSLFGGKKAVWLRGVNFLSDKRPGNTESGKAEIEKLTAFLERIDPTCTALIISACPVDRRRKEFKWFQKNCTFTDIKADSAELIPIIQAECETQKVTIDSAGTQALIDKIGPNIRLLVEEISKLATYLNGEKHTLITAKLVAELVPDFGEGDFFEVSEAFFALDLDWTLDALRRHFFLYDEARPLISGLQNRNRLLIQLRALVDAKAITVSPRGIDKTAFERAAATYGIYYGNSEEKSNFNVFTQNAWYLGSKVGANVGKLNMKKLISIQQALIEAFQGIITYPNEQKRIMETMAIKCLT